MLLSSTGVIPSSQHEKEFAYKVEELNKNTDAMKNRLDDLETSSYSVQTISTSLTRNESFARK